MASGVAGVKQSIISKLKAVPGEGGRRGPSPDAEGSQGPSDVDGSDSNTIQKVGLQFYCPPHSSSLLGGDTTTATQPKVLEAMDTTYY